MDRPFEEVALIAKAMFDDGHTIFQKFTCHYCNARQTMEEPNRFFTIGTCDECGSETDLVRAGCGYMLAMGHAR
jgi:hypothetical protein